jgi:hypothetical protein
METMKTRNFCIIFTVTCFFVAGIVIGAVVFGRDVEPWPVIATSTPNMTLQNAVAQLYQRPVWQGRNEPQKAIYPL